MSSVSSIEILKHWREVWNKQRYNWIEIHKYRHLYPERLTFFPLFLQLSNWGFAQGPPMVAWWKWDSKSQPFDWKANTLIARLPPTSINVPIKVYYSEGKMSEEVWCARHFSAGTPSGIIVGDQIHRYMAILFSNKIVYLSSIMHSTTQQKSFFGKWWTNRFDPWRPHHAIVVKMLKNDTTFIDSTNNHLIIRHIYTIVFHASSEIRKIFFSQWTNLMDIVFFYYYFIYFITTPNYHQCKAQFVALDGECKFKDNFVICITTEYRVVFVLVVAVFFQLSS